MVLTADELDRLEEAVRNNALEHTIGFFFGVSDGSETDDDLEFIRKAHEATQQGATVLYNSWW